MKKILIAIIVVLVVVLGVISIDLFNSKKEIKDLRETIENMNQPQDTPIENTNKPQDTPIENNTQTKEDKKYLDYVGTYTNNQGEKIILKKDKTCEIHNIKSDYCGWDYTRYTTLEIKYNSYVALFNKNEYVNFVGNSGWDTDRKVYFKNECEKELDKLRNKEQRYKDGYLECRVHDNTNYYNTIENGFIYNDKVYTLQK